jgi:excinuclease UvrABC nuclease subunit
MIMDSTRFAIYAGPYAMNSALQSHMRYNTNATRYDQYPWRGKPELEVRMAIVSPRFYVYVLCRPNGKPFYVGKGSGLRHHVHETEARSGCHCHRCNVIRKIWRAGGEVQRYIVFTTNDEAEALAYEIETIALYGRHNLTNKTDGGEGASNPSADVRSRRSATEKATKSTPEMRAALREQARAVWANPENRARHAAAISMPEARARRGYATQQSWTNPETKEKRITALRAALATPEVRAHRSKVSKAMWERRKARVKEDADD